MITGGATPFVFLFKWGNIDLINNLAHNSYRMIYVDHLIQRWWQQHDLSNIYRQLINYLINAIRRLCYITRLPHKRPYILRWLPQADMPSSKGEDGK